MVGERDGRGGWGWGKKGKRFIGGGLELIWKAMVNRGKSSCYCVANGSNGANVASLLCRGVSSRARWGAGTTDENWRRSQRTLTLISSKTTGRPSSQILTFLCNTTHADSQFQQHAHSSHVFNFDSFSFSVGKDQPFNSPNQGLVQTGSQHSLPPIGQPPILTTLNKHLIPNRIKSSFLPSIHRWPDHHSAV